jgi:hypothetical protein
MNEKTPPDWKSLLMRILKCWGYIHNDWFENYWHKFGITKEEGRELIREYEKYEQENVK